MRTVAERLKSLHNRATAYELVAEHGEQRVLVCYSSNKGRDLIMQAIRNRADAMIALTGAETLTFAQRAADGATMGAWRIYYSGRTQREAIVGGVLPYVGNLGG